MSTALIMRLGWTFGLIIVFVLTISSGSSADIDHRMGLLVMATAEVCLWAVGLGVITTASGLADEQ